MEHNQRLQKSLNNIDNNILSLNLSTKESDRFNKVDNSFQLKEGSGIGALVLFKKISKKKPVSEPKTVIIQENNYLIDGRKKSQKEQKEPQLIEGKKQYTRINNSYLNSVTSTTIKNKTKQLNINNKDNKTGIDSSINITKEIDKYDNSNEIDKTSLGKRARMNNYIRNNDLKNYPTGSINGNNKSNHNNKSQSLGNSNLNANAIGNEPGENKNMTKTVMQTRNLNLNITKHNSESIKEKPLEKRKQYAVPPVKAKKAKSFSVTDNSLNNNPNNLNNNSNNSLSFISPEEAEQKRQERLKDLLFNNEKLCIMKYQKHEIDQMKQKEYIEMAKKMKFLQMNDVNVEELVTEQFAHQEENENVEGNDNNNKEEEEGVVETEEMDDDNQEQQEKQLEENSNDNNNNNNDELLGISTINQLETKENVNNNINNNSVSTNKNQTVNKSNNSHLTYSNTSNVYGKRSQSDSTNSKEFRKQKIDTFEYMMKIHQERGTKIGLSINGYGHKSVNNNIALVDDNQKEINKPINSFRQSSLSQNKESGKNPNKSNKVIIVKADKKTNFIYDEDNNFVCSYKQNINTTTTNLNKAQIREFMIEQRTKSKEKAIKVIEEEKMKQFKKYIELSKMQEIIYNNRRAVARKKKIRNEYYVGSHIRRRNSNQITESASTIIDPNDMLNNILESNKIITNGLLNEDIKRSQNNNEDDEEEEEDNYSKSNKSNNRSSHQDRDNDSLIDQSANSSTGFNKGLTKEIIKNISKEAIQKGESNNEASMNNSTASYGKLKESFLEKVNHTVKKANELLYSDALNQVLKSSFPKMSYNNSIDTVSDNDAIEDQVNIPIGIRDNQKNEFYDLMNNNEYNHTLNQNNHNNNFIEELTLTPKNSIQVPSTIHQSNIASITYDKDIEKKRESSKDEEIEVEVEDITKEKYNFTKEILDNYKERFERFNEWFTLFNIRNSFIDIITYGNIKLRYKIGFECMINIVKSNVFYSLDYYSKYSIYSNTLRKLFFPYIKRALYQMMNYSKEDTQQLEDQQTTKKKVMEWMNNHELSLPVKEQEKDIKINNNNQNDNEESSESEEEKEIEIEYDENYVQNLHYGLMHLRLPFVVYSMQKIVEYAYSNYDDNKGEVPIKEIQQLAHNNPRCEDKFNPNQDEEEGEEEKYFNQNKHNLSGEHNNTYMYNSFESKSSIILYPNSEKSDRLHRIYELVGIQKEDQNNSFNDLNNDNSNFFNKNNLLHDKSDRSISEVHSDKKSKSSKSIGEIAKMKPGISLKNSMNSLKSKSNRSNNQSIDNDNSFNKSIDNHLKKDIQSNKDVNYKATQENDINLPLSPSSSLQKRVKIEKDIKQENCPITAIAKIKSDNLLSSSPMKSNEYNYVNRLEKCLTISEQDISADKDINNLVDWEYNLTGNKASLSGTDDINRQSLKDKDKLKLTLAKDQNKAVIKEENSENASKENDNMQFDQFLQDDVKEGKISKHEGKKTEFNQIDKNEENNYDNEFGQQMNISDVLDDDNLDSFMNSEKNDKEDNEDNAIDEEILLDQKDKDKEIILVPTPINDKSQSIDNVFTKEISKKNSLGEKTDNIIPNPIIQEQKSIRSENSNKENNNDKNDKEESESSCLIIKDKPEIQSCIFLDNASSHTSNTFSYVNLNTPNDNKSNLSDITDNNNKLKNFIPPSNYNNKPIVQKRYDETDLRHHEIIEQAEPISSEALADIISSEVIKNLLIEEISTEKHKLLPKKLMRSINFQDHMDNSSLQMSRSLDKNTNSPRRPMLQVSMNNNRDINICNTSNDGNQYLNTSIFIRTIDEIKKEITLNLYNDKIAPRLIADIMKEIDDNYKSIQIQLQAPLVCNVELLIKGLIEKDDNLITASKNKLLIPSRSFIRKRELLTTFNKVNKQLRNDDNITSDNYYDNILNECLIDASNEIIGSERLYGNVGQPLPWSNRTRHIKCNYDNSINSKEKLKGLVKEELERCINTRMGLIPENHECMDVEQLSLDRDKKFAQCLGRELSDNQDIWLNYETEETQIKLALSKIIMDQLLNETVEILEHVHYSRHEPSKYQSKSIYACEDIPRLSFQFTTENDIIDTINQ